MQDNDRRLPWWATRDGQQFGPIEGTELFRLIETGDLRPQDYIWRPGLDVWVTVAEAGLASVPYEEEATQDAGSAATTATPATPGAASEPELTAAARPVVADAPSSAPRTAAVLTAAAIAPATPEAGADAGAALPTASTTAPVATATSGAPREIPEPAAAEPAIASRAPETGTTGPAVSALAATALALERLSKQAEPATAQPVEERTRALAPVAEPTATATATPHTEPQAQPRPVCRRGGALVYGLLVLLTIGLSLASCMQFLGEGSGKPEVFAAKGADRGNALHLSVQIVEANLVREQMRLHLVPTLTGTLAAGSARLPAREIELTIATMSGPRAIALKRDHHLEPFDVDIALNDGDILVYPMDRYTARVEVEALALGPGGQQAADKVPVVVSFASRSHAAHVEARPGPSEVSNVVIDLEVARLLPIVVFTWFMAGVAAVIALAVVLTVTMVFTGRREPDLGMLAWTAALLFALPAVRNNLPGAPPLGALIDYSAFFWAQALVGLSMLVLLWQWVTHRAAEG